MTSLTYKAGRIRFDDLAAERSYSGFHRYSDSKLAELLAVREFAERMDRYAPICGLFDCCLDHPALVAMLSGSTIFSPSTTQA